jgi:RNA polymerase sigma-70 factor (ECF subfamily)
MTGADDDFSLIAASRMGQTDAFGMLVNRYQDRLYPTALRLTGRPEDALDLLQDTFLRAFEKLKGFQGESSFYTWIYRIAVNLALSERRKKHPLRLRRGGDDRAPEIADAATDCDPSSNLLGAERDRLIQDALNSLAPDHRAVVVMKEFDGLRYEEIATMLNVPVGTVRSRLHRARLDLKVRLQSLIDEPETSPTALGDP